MEEKPLSEESRLSDSHPSSLPNIQRLNYEIAYFIPTDNIYYQLKVQENTGTFHKGNNFCLCHSVTGNQF